MTTTERQWPQPTAQAVPPAPGPAIGWSDPPVGGVLPSAASRGSAYDVVVYPDGIALIRRTAFRPEIVGALLGLCAGVIFAIIGYEIGLRIAAGGNRTRLAKLLSSPRQHLLARGGSRFIPAVEMRRVVARTDKSFALVRIEGSSGKATNLKWRKVQDRNLDVEQMLPAVLGPRVEVQQRTAIERYWAPLLLVSVIVLIVGIALAAAGGTDTEPGVQVPLPGPPTTAALSPAQQRARDACREFQTNAEATGDDPTLEQVIALFDSVRPDFGEAGSLDPQFADESEAVAYIVDNLRSPPPGITAEQLQAEIDRRAGLIDETCSSLSG